MMVTAARRARTCVRVERAIRVLEKACANPPRVNAFATRGTMACVVKTRWRRRRRARAGHRTPCSSRMARRRRCARDGWTLAARACAWKVGLGRIATCLAPVRSSSARRCAVVTARATRRRQRVSAIRATRRMLRLDCACKMRARRAIAIEARARASAVACSAYAKVSLVGTRATSATAAIMVVAIRSRVSASAPTGTRASSATKSSTQYRRAVPMEIGVRRSKCACVARVTSGRYAITRARRARIARATVRATPTMARVHALKATLAQTAARARLGTSRIRRAARR
mmetsp:Transcript_7549/g.27573  ORF Transcript_7549/g.27573 Transcript_7549/m.27573 type:complete len:287 (+) Transcript_7549:1490-2350(+)